MEHLPIHSLLPTISEAFIDNHVTIVATPTGSGKTLLVPKEIMQFTEGKVWLTVPRVLLAKQASQSMSRLVFGGKQHIGVMTGSHTSNLDASIIVATEGSFMNRVTLAKEDTLIIDEVHEQGVLTEQVLYIAREHAMNGGKVMLMSATIDLQKYIAYYEAVGLKVGVISMPESKTAYHIEETEVENTFTEICFLEKNTLIGCVGKNEMETIRHGLQRLGWKHKIFDLHGEVEDWQEQEALECQDTKIILATSVAMSGITFENLEVVVPPMEGKRVEDSLLVKYNLSRAEVKQWRGRVGRVKDGICLYPVGYANSRREDNPMPQILLNDLRDTVLSFAYRGYNLLECELLNQPDANVVKYAQRRLEKLGLLNKQFAITDKGREVMSYGEGLFMGLFIYAGKKLGIESTARKMAFLCSAGTPYRQKRTGGQYRFAHNLLKTCSICKMSEHYLALRCIEEDIDAHFTGWSSNDELVRVYGEQNNIFLRGVSRLRKQFQKVDKEFKDDVVVTLPVLQNLFSMQPKENIFENHCNSQVGYLNSRLPYAKLYATLAPIETAQGRLADMTTALTSEISVIEDSPF